MADVAYRSAAIGTGTTVSAPSGAAVGDLLVVGVTGSSTPAIPAGWTQIGTSETINGYTTKWAWRIRQSGDTTYAGWTNTEAYAIIDFYNTDPTSPVYAQDTFTSTADPIPLTSLTASVTAGDAAVYISIGTGFGTYTAPASYTESVDQYEVTAGRRVGLTASQSTSGNLDPSASSSFMVLHAIIKSTNTGGSTYTLAAAGGSYALSGTAATVKVARKIAAANGTLVVTGSAAGLLRASKLAAGAGSYSMVGTAVTFRLGKALTAQPGAFALAGTAAALKAARRIATSGGAYSLTGTAVALERAAVLSAGGGSYTLTGASAGLYYSGSNPVIDAQNGAFTVTGSAAGLEASRILVAAAGGYGMAGTTASLLRSLQVSASPGSYLVAGQSATFERSRAIVAAAAAYSVTGMPAGLWAAHRLSAVPGAYLWSGAEAALLFGAWRPVAQPGAARFGSSLAESACHSSIADSRVRTSIQGG